MARRRKRFNPGHFWNRLAGQDPGAAIPDRRARAEMGVTPGAAREVGDQARRREVNALLARSKSEERADRRRRVEALERERGWARGAQVRPRRYVEDGKVKVRWVPVADELRDGSEADDVAPQAPSGMRPAGASKQLSELEGRPGDLAAKLLEDFRRERALLSASVAPARSGTRRFPPRAPRVYPVIPQGSMTQREWMLAIIAAREKKA